MCVRVLKYGNHIVIYYYNFSFFDQFMWLNFAVVGYYAMYCVCRWRGCVGGGGRCIML